MATILDRLAEHAGERVAEAKKTCSEEEMKARALEICASEAEESPSGNAVFGTAAFPFENGGRGTAAFSFENGDRGTAAFPFEKALSGPEPGFICECKKASPSKGLIAPEFPYLSIAKEYEAAGAAAISVLTEPKWFLGSNRYLAEIAEAVSIPVLRKDFIVDEYMIYEAKVLGASAVLLICAILPEETVAAWIRLCDSLGLSALVEAHDEEEVAAAVRAGARVIGVNNRNLKDFTVDLNNSIRLRKCAPPDRIFVAESGIRTAEDVETLRQNGVNGILVGETLMRAADKKAELAKLRGAR